MSTNLIIVIVLAVALVAYYWYTNKNKKKSNRNLEVEATTQKSKLSKNIVLNLVIVVAIVAGVGYYCYNKYYKDDSVSIPLSEAISLSQSNTFNDLVIQNRGGASTLELKVADNINLVAKDVNDKDVTLKTDDKVVVDIGYVTIKDLTDMGFVLPKDYRSETSSSSSSQWFIYLFYIALIGIFVYYYIFALGRSGSKKFAKDKNSITFKDIGGVGEVKDSLNEVVSFLRDDKYFERLGAKIPRGILLEGAPGVGKTLIARAVATEANVAFYYTSGSELQDKFAGVAALKVKNLFRKAKKTRSVIFIDEVDSIAETRLLGGGEASREWNHVVNQLLAEMDGFEKNDKVVVIAATNRADVLDPAVLRAGRFDRRITVSLPSLKDRVEILKIHAREKPFGQDVSLTDIAKQTSGFSGADLALLLNESAIIAGREKQSQIFMKHINKAIDKVLTGDARLNLTVSPEDKNLIAYHEAGHAAVATLLKDSDKVQRISILPRGQAGGFTRVNDDVEHLTLSKSKALAKITMLLGGRASEEILLKTVTSSAQNDLQRANELAREMVEHLGMSENFGLRYVLKNSTGLKDISIDTQHQIDSDIESILKECYQSAKVIIIDNKDLVEKLVTRLLEVETIDAIEIEGILKKE